MSGIIGIIILTIVETLSALALYRLWKRHTGAVTPFLKGLICTVLCVILLTCTCYLLLSDASRPSTIDISPLEELDESDISLISQRINNLEYSAFTRYEANIVLGVADKESAEKEIIKMYYSTKSSAFMIESAVVIEIYRFQSSKWSNDKFSQQLSMIYHRYELSELPNGIRIIKGNSWMDRNADSYYMSHDRRIMYTYFVIGEFFFFLDESSYSTKSRGVATSECIRMICEVLST